MPGDCFAGLALDRDFDPFAVLSDPSGDPEPAVPFDQVLPPESRNLATAKAGADGEPEGEEDRRVDRLQLLRLGERLLDDAVRGLVVFCFLDGSDERAGHESCKVRDRQALRSVVGEHRTDEQAAGLLDGRTVEALRVRARETIPERPNVSAYVRQLIFRDLSGHLIGRDQALAMHLDLERVERFLAESDPALARVVARTRERLWSAAMPPKPTA